MTQKSSHADNPDDSNQRSHKKCIPQNKRAQHHNFDALWRLCCGTTHVKLLFDLVHHPTNEALK